jgi:hypothetical protein
MNPRALVLIAGTVLTAGVSAAAGQSDALLGFSAVSSAAERALEARFDANLSADGVRAAAASPQVLDTASTQIEAAKAALSG